MRRHSLLTCFLLLVLPLRAATAQLSERPARVEVVAPKAPIPVIVDGKRVLAYELHVTNFGRGALGFHEIDVLNANASAREIVSYRDTALKNLLQPIGSPSDARRLDPGQRTVVYFWISFPTDASVPVRLRHRIIFDILDSADVRRDLGTQSAIDDILVDVSKDVALVVRSPLSEGEWIGAGPSNDSDHRRSLSAVDGRAYISQRFAMDWMKIGPNGNTYHDDEHKNESYWSFGQLIHSVASGEVVVAVDSIADHTPHAPLPRVTLANLAGNYVTIRIAPNRYATYAHLKRGSIRVRVGQRVVAGEVIGLLGDTGQATAPHLHFQITDAPSVLGSEGVPFVLDQFRFLGYGNDFEETKHPDEPRRLQLPVDGEVIGIR
jgi:murein DD-endopeptidase